MYEIVVQAIIVRPLLMELGPYQPGTDEFNHWAGMFLFLPTVLGGMAALGGGYLTDRIGRQRVLVWSIVLYAIAAFMSGFATSLYELMFWRCITVAGACVEFVAAIAWLTELYPEPRRREAMLGYAQACATLGNFMIAGAYYAAVTWGDSLPAVHGGHSAWRYALLFGALPAIPLMILRPFLPEGARVTRRQDARPAFSRDGTVYAFRRDTLERHGSIYGEDCRPLVIGEDESLSIDTPRDWAEAERALQARTPR
jgi:MFS family permease